jgi:thiol-disulfide isomerase/thioredoxin
MLALAAATMRTLLIACALLMLPACHKAAQPAANQAAPAAADEPAKGIDRSHKGQAAPAATFIAPDGDDIGLADLRGPVLVNLWATWCAPCVKELPTLNRLARSHDQDGALGVVAVSQDTGPQASVEAFMAKLKVEDLGVYHDPKMALSAALGPDTVLPTTILFDANGKEVWRYVGDLDWTGPEAAKLLAEAAPPEKG